MLTALLIDRLLGEPPARLHPVVWMGRYLSFFGSRLTSLKPAASFPAGAGIWLLGAIGSVAMYLALEDAIALFPPWCRWLVFGLALKPLLALRALTEEVRGVETALADGLENGRRQLSRIVSRDTSLLSESGVRESALESLSENLSDSLVAPLFWFFLLGLPGAALYRFANTADAMWGYRGKWEWAGKWAARADDVLNFVPARLTALLLAAFSPRLLRRIGRLPAEAAKTPSPNSGWPMAALALAHGIRLVKPGVYVLNPDGSPPPRSETQGCLRHATLAAWSTALLLTAVGLISRGLFHV